MKPYKEQTYYELLEVDASASMDEIRMAYDRALRLYDPESVALYPVGDPTQVDDLKKLLLEAFEILTDEDLRGEYDSSLGLAPWTSSGHTGIVAAQEAMQHPPDAAELDARAAASRKEGDVHVQAEAALHPEVTGAAEVHVFAAEPSHPVSVSSEALVRAIGPEELDARAEASRAEGDARSDADARSEADGQPDAGGERSHADLEAVVDVRRNVDVATDGDSPRGVEARLDGIAPRDEDAGRGADVRRDSEPPRGSEALLEAEAQPDGGVRRDDDARSDADARHVVEPATDEDGHLSADASRASDGASVVDAPASGSGEAEGPDQLVLTEVLSRADTVHSTAPRYSISYIPRPPRPEHGEPGLVESGTAGQPAAFGSGTRAPRGESPDAVPGAPPAGSPDDSPFAGGEAREPEHRPAHTPAVHRPVEAPAQVASSAVSEPSRPGLGNGALAQGAPAPASTAPAPSGNAAPRASPHLPPPLPESRGMSRQLDQAPLIAQEAAIANAESALAQVSQHAAARAREVREVREVRPRPPEIPPEADITGELLRQVRKSRGFTVHQLADRTRIAIRHLENVEADRYEALPPAVYLRGILMSLARELALDPVRVSRSYLSLVDKALGKTK